MKHLAKKAVWLLLAPLFFLTAFFGIAALTPVSAEEPTEEKTVYDAEKEYPGATGDYAAVSGSGGPQWYYQALDMFGFYAYGTGESNPDTGELTTNTVNTTLWMYPFVRNGNQGNGTPTEMKDGSGTKNLDFLVQYPAGNGIANTDAEIGTGYYTSSCQFANFYGGQWVHPGTNLAVVYSFKVPRTGAVYLKDDIRVIAGGNGVRLAVYHQSKAAAEAADNRGNSWGGSVAMNLYGAKPVYPTPKVHMQDSGAGWQLIPAGGTFRFITDNFDVEEGDMIHFILDANGSINSDQTFFAPKVIYGQRPDELLLNKSEATLAAPANEEESGETCQLTATIRPAASADKKVTFSSSDTSVATVSESGLITAMGVGTATVTATLENGVSEDGNPVTATCLVTVVPPDDSISIIQGNGELSVEQAYTLQLEYEILPPSSSGKNVVWSIESQSPETEGLEVLALSDTGLVTAKNAGTAVVRVTIEGSDVYCERTVTVTSAPAPTLTAEKASVNLTVGGSATVTTAVTPLFHAGDEVTVAPYDEEILTAEWESGTLSLSAKKAGTVNLTISVAGGNSVDIAVNVLAEAKKVYDWRSSFKTEQGPEWYYYLQKEGDGNYTELRYSTSEWGAYEEDTGKMLQSGGFVPKAADMVPEVTNPEAYNQYLLCWQGHMIHPGKGYNVVLAFRAPLTGTLDFTSYFRSYDNRSDGVRVRVLKGEEQIFPATGRQVVSYGNPVEAAVCNLEVTAGHMFYIIIDCNEANAFDSCYLNPEFRYTDYEVVPDRLEMSLASVSVSAGKEVLLTATIFSTDGTDKAITWSSSDETIATVNRFGVVTALKTGTVTITAELEDGTKSECVLTVTAGDEAQQDSGCNGSVALGTGSAAMIAATALGAIVLKKKKNRRPKNGNDGLNENNGEDQNE